MSSSPEKLDLSQTGAHRTMRESVARWIFFGCAVLTVLATIGIIVVLVTNSLDFFAEYSPLDFVTGTRWSPTIKDEFGILPLLSGTLIITFGSATIALPVGVATAVYLSEFASPRVRGIIKPFLEVLAGVPTVVYGYFALVYITPAFQYFMPQMSTFNATSAAVVVGIMIIPFVSSISEDAMHAVPDSLRQASYGLGATKFHTTVKVVIPAAISGIISSFILAFSRAIGETMAVTIAAGQTARLFDPTAPQEMLLMPVQTMTAAMVNLGRSDVSGQSLAYRSLFAVGLALFVITFAMNLIGEYVSAKYQEKYR